MKNEIGFTAINALVDIKNELSLHLNSVPPVAGPNPVHRVWAITEQALTEIGKQVDKSLYEIDNREGGSD